MRPEGREALDSLYFEYPRFAYHPAPEQSGDARVHDVVIVGAGPVGLVAALELARFGIPSVIVDEKRTVNDGSRAICLARHSMESLRGIGVADRFLELALGWTSGRSYYRGEQVYTLEMPHSPEQRYLPMYNLQQQFIERFLVDAAEASALVDLRFGHRVEHAEALADEDGANVLLSLCNEDGAYELRARYCLAADGARSRVRHALGLALHGEAYEARYVIADIRLRSDFPTERRAFFDPSSNPGATLLVHKQPLDIWRVDWQLEDDESDEDALEEGALRAKIGAILDMLGEEDSWELEWWSIYKAYTLCLDDYRHDGYFFIGDAAHLVPIFGVRGLNSGVADAGNVAWKIAWALRHDAADGLLDSYSPERRGATLEVFDNAAKSTRFMSPPTYGYQLARDATLSLALKHDFARPFLNPRQATPYTYAESKLSTVDETAADSGPAVGAPIVDCRLDDGTFLLDDMPARFLLLAFVDEALPDWLKDESLASRADQIQIKVICRRAKQGSIARIVDADGSVFARYGARAGSTFLVRPDRHVTARWHAPIWQDIENAYLRACGRSDESNCGPGG